MHLKNTFKLPWFLFSRNRKVSERNVFSLRFHLLVVLLSTDGDPDRVSLLSAPFAGRYLGGGLLSVVLRISLEQVVVEFIEVRGETTVHVVPPVADEIFLKKLFSTVLILMYDARR